jgi:hypothetical protein
MELSLLLQIEAHAALWERIAVGRLAAGDVTGAEAAAAKSLLRQRRPLALMLRMFTRDASPFWGEASKSDGH